MRNRGGSAVVTQQATGRTTCRWRPPPLRPVSVPTIPNPGLDRETGYEFSMRSFTATLAVGLRELVLFESA